jgi:hypothetical protein
MLAGCQATGTALSDGEIVAYKARIDAGFSAPSNVPCPAFGGGSMNLAAETAALQKQIAASRATIEKARDDHVKSIWGQGAGSVVGKKTIDRAVYYYDVVRDAAAADLLVAARKWEQAAVAGLAADVTPLDPARYVDHPVWKGATHYAPTIAAIRSEIETYDRNEIDPASKQGVWMRSSRPNMVWDLAKPSYSTSKTKFGEELRAVGSSISACASGYRAEVAGRNAPALASYAQRFTSLTELDSYFRNMGVSLNAGTSPALQPLRTSVADLRSRFVAVEQAKAEAERQRQEAERQRLAEQARQSQLLAAEAQRQAQQAAAQAQAALERNQEIWRARWVAGHKAANYKCEGGTYTKGVPFAPARGKYDGLQFYIRLPADHRFIEITQSSGLHGFSSGRRDIKFVSPTAVTFTFNHREGGVLGAPERLWPGSVTIDLDTGKLTGFFSFVAEPLSLNMSTSYEMYCAKD